jgi:hypothetical protein
LFAAEQKTVPTYGTAQAARNQAAPTRFDGPAVLRATVARPGVAVVAGFVGGKDAVATHVLGLARPSRIRTSEAIFDLTIGRTSVVARGVAVVARLGRFKDAVTA